MKWVSCFLQNASLNINNYDAIYCDPCLIFWPINSRVLHSTSNTSVDVKLEILIIFQAVSKALATQLIILVFCFWFLQQKEELRDMLTLEHPVYVKYDTIYLHACKPMVFISLKFVKHCVLQRDVCIMRRTHTTPWELL